MNLEIWHNLLWSRYKGAVFTALAAKAETRGVTLALRQIALTDRSRALLSPVGSDHLAYPHDVLFPVSYDQIPPPRLWREVARRAWRTQADVVMIPGVDRPEYWILALILWARGRRRAAFYDSTQYDHPARFLRKLGKRVFFALVPWSLSYGARAREAAISHGVHPDRALLRVQAAYLPAGYDAAQVPDLRITHAPPAPQFLYVGRFSAEKRVDSLLDAFAAYHRQRPDASLRLVGAGALEAALRKQAERLGIEGAVIFDGARNGVALGQAYLEATALVLPSASEPWGIVVNEALHHGCPVIVSDRCGCVPELVADSPVAMAFPAGDVSALTRALAEGADRWQDRGAVARECLASIAPYSAEHAASQILAAAEQIAAA